MKYILKVFNCLLMMGMMVILSGCGDHDTIELEGLWPLSFEVINTNAYNGESPLMGLGGYEGNNTVVGSTIVMDGQTLVVTGSWKTNELPVTAGNELEIVFKPRNAQESKACFILPDGDIKEVTASSPSFKWTVPDNFKAGMKIKGEGRYATDDGRYKAEGSLYLIPIEEYIK